MAEQTKPEAEPKTKSYDELLEEKKAIQDLLASLEDDYREASISEEAYAELKQKNLKRLAEVEKLLKRARREAAPAVAAPAAETVEELLAKKVEPLARSVSGEMDKLKLLINTVKEGLAATNERLQVVGEQLAELRAFSHQREARMRDFEIKFTRLSDLVSGLEVTRLKREFEKRDKTLSEHAMRIEKFERMLDLLREKQTRVRRILEEIGSIENVLALLKEIEGKLKQARKRSEGVERTAEKMEKLYIDLRKKLDEFSAYKEGQTKLKELVKEMMADIKELGVKLGECARKEDVESMREMLERRIESLRAEAEELVPEPIRKLREEKVAIEDLLETLTHEYEEGVISEKDYRAAREKNVRRLRQIEEQISKTWRELRRAKPAEVEKRPPKKEERLVAELDELLRRGMISREAYERSKRILLGA